jgi:hypothetical protein
LWTHGVPGVKNDPVSGDALAVNTRGNMSQMAIGELQILDASADYLSSHIQVFLPFNRRA